MATLEPSKWKQLDALVRRSDPDSCDWADGLGCEQAAEQLAAFDADDWAELSAALPPRSASWRGCLVSALDPSAAPARGLLFELAFDADDEVAYGALVTIATCCGIGLGALDRIGACKPLQIVRVAKESGLSDSAVIFDPSKAMQGFSGEACAVDGLAERARGFSSNVAPSFAAMLQELAKHLEPTATSNARR